MSRSIDCSRCTPNIIRVAELYWQIRILALYPIANKMGKIMRKMWALGLVLTGLSSWSLAASSPEAEIQAQLQKIDPRLKAVSVEAAPMAGMYEVELNSGELLYSDAKGEYFLFGKLFQLSPQEGFVNITERKLKGQRLKQLAAVAEQDMVIFPATGERKATVTVFTDVDCGYCRKLHAEVPELNRMGIQVNYLAFPRAGVGSNAYQQMESIWCAAPGKRNEMMSLAKKGGRVEPAQCQSPILQQMQIGNAVGVTGTPALVFEDGTLLPGYLPAKRLAEAMKVRTN